MEQLKYSKDYFKTQREQMVKEQIIARGVKNKSVISAMLKVEREQFVPESLWDDAYGDYPLPIGEAQTISQPYMVAEMTAKLDPQKEDKILEIGTGSGYQSAVLAELVKEVYTIETIESLANKAEEKLNNLGYKNIFVKIGDGSIGLPEYAPYDGIIVTAGAPATPEPLFEQLKEGGKIVIPTGDRTFQKLIRITKKEGKKSRYVGIDCMFVSLVGTYGWK